ncbi:MAG: manganese efflux pump MntP family protein [Prevotellaceae bacterium]|nr:manganese efflux pump MntP family protein [Prevotellaceae bacterium]MDD6781033.1 manganese efflux pump MntP family protein [Prevotellaceae bacterium]
MLSFLDIALLSVALAMDCFTVSIVCGISCRRWMPRLMLQMSVLFGVFQALMPLIGWLGTSLFSQYLEAVDHWIAFGLLSFLGGRMIRESVSSGNNEEHHSIPSALTTQLLLAVATSIDALAIGISFACTGYKTVAQLSFPLVVIGVGSFLFSVLGNRLGIRFGIAIRRKLNPELFGGLVLIFIGIKVLLTHILNL